MDVFDNKYKYIGIVKGDTYSNLTRRIKQHRKEVWFKNSEFEVDYIEVPTICDAEAIEGSLIGKYQTYKYYNKAKKNWGESTLFEICDNAWKVYGIESLQSIYRKTIDALSDVVSNLIMQKEQLEKECHRLKDCLVIDDRMSDQCLLSVIENDLKEKIELYEQFSIDCSTKTTADKWAYRANRLKSAIWIVKNAILERQYYGYSKEYREDNDSSELRTHAEVNQT